MKLVWHSVLAVACLAWSGAARGDDTTSLSGQVTDPSGAAVPGARVEASQDGRKSATSTDAQGRYALKGLAPGSYALLVARKSFAPHREESVALAAGEQRVLDVKLELAEIEEDVTVESQAALSLAPEDNAGALVLKGEDLESLPDDPDELADALQALAGPSAGPNGGQIFIDGFTSGRMPPLASILEIRINANPFSAEYDRIGFGRIEVITKPGSDHFRANLAYRFNDEVLNSQNPFAGNKPPYQRRDWSGDVSGPLVKGKASYFMDFENRSVDDNAIVNSTVLDADLLPTSFDQAFVTPQRRTSLSPRVDFALSDAHQMSVRYSYTETKRDDSGIGGFSLPSRSYDSLMHENVFQLADTLIFNKKVVSQTHARYWQTSQSEDPLSTLPSVEVQDAFTGGGASIGNSSHEEKRFELSNTTTWSLGKHALRAGFRLRTGDVDDDSEQNFTGTLSFAGGLGPELDATGAPVLGPDGQPLLVPLTSLERYRRTLLFQGQGLSPAQIRGLGGGASQLVIAGGDPLATVSQWDLAPFFQDDWKLRDDLTLSFGLRYEVQQNISDHGDFAPRLAFAWSPGAKAKGAAPKTVIRGGFGIFYDRVDDGLTLQTRRYDGVSRQQFLVSDDDVLDSIEFGPDQVPTLPSIADLTAFSEPQAVRSFASDLRAPYTIQSALSVERQLPYNFTATGSLLLAEGRRQLRSRVIAAPSLGDSGIVYQFESTGRSNQVQAIFGLNNRGNKVYSVFFRYFLGWAKSDTDGSGTFPADGGDLLAEYADAGIDIRHRVVLGGNVHLPWGISVSPFITAASGRPFNITTGRDNNGDTIFTDRPAYATDPTRPGVVMTAYGLLDPNPIPGEVLIPRNLGRSPGFFAVNLRLSKAIPIGKQAAATDTGDPNRPQAPFGGGGGGFRGRGPGGGGGGRGGGGRQLTLSLQVQNLLNTVNPAAPVGNISSPLFGQSLASAGFFGGPGGGASSGAGNRRIELQARLGL